MVVVNKNPAMDARDKTKILSGLLNIKARGEINKTILPTPCKIFTAFFTFSILLIPSPASKEEDSPVNTDLSFNNVLALFL